MAASSGIVLNTATQVKQTVHVDPAEAARKKAADAAAAAAAAAELRASVGQSNMEAAAAPSGTEAYDHTGGDAGCKPHVGSGRPGPGGGGGGASRVVGAAECAQRDRFNHEKRNEVRLNTAHSGTDASESGPKLRTPTTGTHLQHKDRPGAEVLSPVQQAYAARPCATAAARCTALIRPQRPRCFQGLEFKFCRPGTSWPISSRGTVHTRCGLRSAVTALALRPARTYSCSCRNSSTRA
jgi:hypothetical protein